jgi:hypothetical protein
LYGFVFYYGFWGDIMQLIEAALAFAITMLVLSLTSSSFVEIIHRVFLMREAGLKYMLTQLFDQVIMKYVKPAVAQQVQADQPNLTAVERNAAVQTLLASVRTGFIERMTSNRAPMGVATKPTPNTPLNEITDKLKPVMSLWGGRDLASMTASQFMERLGSIDVGKVIDAANTTANTAARTAGAAAADKVDAVLKDIAQKFEAFGNEASVYFEGRARLLSVLVAIALAFAIRVDAVELFNTYLRDPNARNSVIEQTKAVTAQYQAAKEATEALKSAGGNAEDAKKQADKLQKDLQTTIDSTRTTVKQYADLGLPIGWSNQNATLDPSAKTCSRNGTVHLLQKGSTCADGETEGTVGCGAVVKLFFSLLLGGLLIGLGAPFWYNTVTGLTNIRAAFQGGSGGAAPQAGGAAPQAAAPQVAGQGLVQQQAPAISASPDRQQPSTPVGAFNVSRGAQDAAG